MPYKNALGITPAYLKNFPYEKKWDFHARLAMRFYLLLALVCFLLFSMSLS